MGYRRRPTNLVAGRAAALSLFRLAMPLLLVMLGPLATLTSAHGAHGATLDNAAGQPTYTDDGSRATDEQPEPPHRARV
jgi:hypothetical protein